MQKDKIILKNVRVHNLKGIDLELNPNQLIVFTGVSGSGKSSLAFDTLFVEGQRRYVESLSNQARRILGEQLAKPDAESIEGLSPTIAIEQKTVGHNPRSTVGTLTSVYDYLRVLYARIGVPHCPISGERILPQSTEQIVSAIADFPKGSKAIFLAPYARGKKGEFKETFDDLLRKGFMRIRLDDQLIDLNEEISVDPKTAHDIDLVIDRVLINPDEMPRIREATTNALELGKGVMSVLIGERETLFSQTAYAKKSKQSYPPLEPHDFSFNHPSGMCPTCQGLGQTLDFDLDQIIDPEKSIAEGACLVAGAYETVRWGNIYDNLAKLYDFDVHTPWKKLPERAQKLFLNGTRKKWLRMQFTHPETGKVWHDYVQWRGVLFDAKKRYQEAKSELYRKKAEALMTQMLCPDCEGKRIRAYPAATKLGGKTITELCSMPIDETLTFFQNIKLTHQESLIGGELIAESIRVLTYLGDVGLNYLTLDRTSPTLSGGEAQRVRLASQIGSGLVGATYVLDEPSIGLHPRDHQKLLNTLCLLRDRGNTVIVVEHDEDTIRAADHIVDVGPGAGSRGGQIIACGTAHDITKAKQSLTGQYLSRKKSIALPKKRRKLLKSGITIKGAAHHNLKNIDVTIPLGGFIAVTGISGSGKSSLISDILYPALSNELMRSNLKVGRHSKFSGYENVDKVIAIDQTAIGRTPRSNPATYTKLFDLIRDLFAQLPESKARGYAPGRFSFNVKEGSCPYCKGSGLIKIDMDFMEAVWKECEQCLGKRFDQETLTVTYKGKSIYDVLCMTIEDALIFFESIPAIFHMLQTLANVGLDYLTLGQPSTTLSGGEAQRIKLAKELTRPSTGSTFYILDEPTTGLHFEDVNNLCKVLHTLVDQGNTVLVIEHNMELVKTADHVIDLGPEGGAGGGQIIATGTPEQIVKANTPTGKALFDAINPKPIDPKPITRTSTAVNEITVEGAAQHNLKHVDLTFPRGQISVCTGPSGSGKTSLVFDTIYAEGQRRYIECLSPYARSFVSQMPKPKVARIEGLSPAIAIEQKHHAGNPRSTVGTMTEIYDYLRILYAHMGKAYCPETGDEIKAISKTYVLKKLLELPEKTKLHILAPIPLKASIDFEALLKKLQRQGFLRVRFNGEYFELGQDLPFQTGRKNTLELVVDRIAVKEGADNRLLEAISAAALIGQGQLIAATPDQDHFFNLAFAVEKTGRSYPPLTPNTFSFNTEIGACPDCTGLGFQWGANFEKMPDLQDYTAPELIAEIWGETLSRTSLAYFTKMLQAHNIPPKAELCELTSTQLQVLFHGSEKPTPFDGATLQWLGLNTVFAKAAKAARSNIRRFLTPLMKPTTCLSCNGDRLSPLARHVEVNQKTLPELCALPLSDARPFIESIAPEKHLSEVYDQLLKRLQFLIDIGIEYISLNRSAPTLSGGEAQRIMLARQLGSGLTGCLYVLDEPTIGLHPHNNALLNTALLKLKALGNTLIMVEHDPLTMEIADQIYDFGPAAGNRGGQLIASGTYKSIQEKDCLTGKYLSGKLSIPIPKKRRSTKETFCIKNANVHNLKNITCNIPLKAFTCLTGLSGSGKSTLMHEVIHPWAESSDTFDKVIALTQNPVGHTIRADIATYSDLLTPLRQFFASLPAAQAKGLPPRAFSYNTKQGMCRTCWGLGFQKIELQFLPPVKVPCSACHGHRLKSLALDVTYKGKHLGHILNMTIDQVLEHLPPIPRVERLIKLLKSVGLGYLKLNQEVVTLSGGEAQRLRLARELKSRRTPQTLYLFDEPTIGLHSSDIANLLPIFHTLVDKGATLIIIEHNLELIANADYIIDLGPEAGAAGGQIVATGPPEQVAQCKASYTGKYLSRILHV
ncbi:MAG: excinuclease ABC subunit UvrA [Chlamydiales bacterium]|nr:excinuclease ABC subunit UvrA [Chlamydiales bacterium]